MSICGGPLVSEIDRAGGQTHITLQYLYVTSEHNRIGELHLNETETRQLIRELQDALHKGARMSEGDQHDIDTGLRRWVC